MSNFINTIDELGDDVVFESILNGSIVEYKDDILTTIVINAFAECNALINVDLPNVTSIGAMAFYNCSSLATVNSPNITSVNTNCFENCSSLIAIDLHKAKKINMYGFKNCSKLKTIILRSDALCTLATNYDLSGTPIASGTGYIYVPRALIEDYKVATYWSTYANQFRALEDYTVDGTTTGALDETKI